MRTWLAMALSAVAVVGLAGSRAQAWHGGWSVGINLGFPVYYRPPCYGYYYAPYPVYVAAPPVVVQPAPVVQPVYAAPAPVAQPAYASPAPTTAAPPVIAQSSPATDNRHAEIDRLMRQLADSGEQARADGALQLGRMRATEAVDALAATLAGDRSPQVREASARALGLIGSPNALPALQQAGLSDSDRDVRHSAQFAMDVIHARN